MLVQPCGVSLAIRGAVPRQRGYQLSGSRQHIRCGDNNGGLDALASADAGVEGGRFSAGAKRRVNVGSGGNDSGIVGAGAGASAVGVGGRVSRSLGVGGL
jgi:hypothetical protein